MTNLERWHHYFRDVESPGLFIDWTWVATIGAALRRNVSLFGPPSSEFGPIYGNMYVIFIAPPGIGKSVSADGSKDMFKSIPRVLDKTGKMIDIIKLGPNTSTVQALIKYLNTNYTIKENIDGIAGKIYTSSPLAFLCTDELASLVQEGSDDLVSFLNTAWDCKDFSKDTIGRGPEFIKNTCMTLIGCAVPEWIREPTTVKLMKSGFAARCVFVYGETKRFRRLRFTRDKAQLESWEHLKRHIVDVTKLFGEVKLSAEADAWYEHYYNSGEMDKARKNPNKRLDEYYSRLKIHNLKTAIGLHFGESLSMQIELSTLQAAIKMNAMTELNMHKALSGGGRNILAGVAEDMIIFAQNNEGTVDSRELILEFYGRGKLDELNDAINSNIQSGLWEAVGGTGGSVNYKLLPAAQKLTQQSTKE